MNLVGNDGGFFALALIPFVKFPTAQNNLGNGAYEGGVGIPYAFDVPNWDVGFQTTVSCNHDRHRRRLSHRDCQFRQHRSCGHRQAGISVEFFSSVSTERNAGWVGTFDTWLTYEVNKNLILDGGVYIGVTAAADGWRPWIGMTWRY